MALLESKLEEKIEEIRQKSRKMITGDNPEDAIVLLEEAWEMLPDGKYEYDESFHIVSYILEAAIKIDNKDCLLKWMDKVLLASPERYDCGEKEMWVGRTYYALGNFEKAREFIEIANKKSGGRCFRPKDTVYKNFFFDNEKEHISDVLCRNGMELGAAVYKKITKLSAVGDIYADREKWDKALKKYYKALELIPEPKYDWEASTWLYVAIGDAYYYKEEYNDAINNMNEALKCPDALGNPFINLRMGQSYYELGDYNNAKRYLIQAYMIDGLKIFEGEPQKYYQLIEGEL